MAQKVFIYACENTYGGLHGMYEIAVEEIDSIKEACMTAEEMSLNVMHSYSAIYEQYRDQAREMAEVDDYFYEEDAEDVYYSCLDEIIEENIYYSIYPIKDEYQNLSTKELYKYCLQEGYESFINKYCDEAI